MASAAASFLSQMAQITPSLYLSSFMGATEKSILKHGITCVITVCKEVPKVMLPYVDSIKLEVLDKPSESLDRYFDTVADKINEIAARKGVCLVHCVAGISRSASMCIVYLMKYHKMTLRDAHEHVKSKRSFIRPNLGFWRQMMDYEKKLLGSNSVKIIGSNFGAIPDVYEAELKNMYSHNSGTSNMLYPQPSEVNPLTVDPPITKRASFKSLPSAVAQSNGQSQSTAAVNANYSQSTNSLRLGNSTSNNNQNRASNYYTTTYGSSYGVQKK